MAREIIFRAKRVDTGDWVEGWYNRSITPAKYKDGYTYCRILQTGIENYFVIPESVGQFIGQLDKNNKRIFEGDILKSPAGNYNVVVWDEKGGFMTEYRVQGERRSRYGIVGKLKEVVGNVHANPELLNK